MTELTGKSIIEALIKKNLLIDAQRKRIAELEEQNAVQAAMLSDMEREYRELLERVLRGENLRV